MARASLVAQMVKNLPAMQETRVQSPGLEDLLEKGMATHSSTLAWKIPWTEEPGRLQSMDHEESDMTEQLHFHFSLSCTGEGNGKPLQFSCLENPRGRGAWWAVIYGSHRVGHDWCDSSSSSRIQLGCKLMAWASLVAQMVKNLPAKQKTGIQSLHQEDPLKKGMASHFSILAWKTPWMEKPGRLQSTGSQRVYHNWAISIIVWSSFFFSAFIPQMGLTCVTNKISWKW